MKQHESDNSAQFKLISHNISENRRYLEQVFIGCSDVVFREISLNKIKQGKYNYNILAVYIDGLIDKEKANSSVFKPLMQNFDFEEGSVNFKINDIKDWIEKRQFTTNVSIVKNIKDLTDAVTEGHIVFMMEGMDEAAAVYLMETIGREIEESKGEVSIFGPSIAFNETISDNLGQLRKIIRSTDMKTLEFYLGRRTKTKVILIYIKGIAEDGLVNEAIKRINQVEIDELQDVRTLDELIGDDAFSLIPLSRHSERPDVMAASLLEGRIVILVDGTPMAIVVPVVIKDFLEAAEDSYSRFPFGAFVRILSYIFVFISIYGSAIFVAFTLFHQEMIPPALLKFIIQSRSEVPFSTFIEIILLEIAYELIREGGGRLPSQSNKAITIIATLIVGTLSARVGFISNITVIIVAVTSIAAFTTPHYSFAVSLRLIRFPLIIAASFWGMYGIIGLTFVTLIYLSSLRSFGIPILTPFAPMSAGDLKDSVIRVPLRYITNRPLHLSEKNRKRMIRKS